MSVTDRVHAVLARLEADLDELTSVSLDPCTDDEVLDALRRVEIARRRLAPVDHALLAEVDTRGVAGVHGCRSTAALVRLLLRVSPGEATARVRAAQSLGPRRTVTGQRLDPEFAAVGAAQAEGAISDRHAQVIVAAVEALPDEVRYDVGEQVEGVLVGVAREHDPHLLARHARDLVNALDQDGTLRDLRYREQRRSLHFRRRADGSARLEGELTPECAEHLATALDALARPEPGSDGVADPRSAAQRRHDALLAVLKLVGRANLLPTAAA